jgi:hypothetical protein
VNIVFGLTVHDEPAGQLDWCLTCLRRAYPKAPVFVVSDGLHPDEATIAEVCRRNRVHFERGQRLKLVQHGSEWWQRFLTLGAAYQPDWLVKMDADTRVRRPLNMENVPNAEVLGRVDDVGRPQENVQGGFQLIRGSAVQQILASGECLSAYWRDPASWARGQCGQLVARGEISTDFTLMGILRVLGLTWARHRQVDSHWRVPKQWRPDAAVTHPHKGMKRVDADPPGISFCTTCYNRLSFLRQTLPRNLAVLDPRDEIVLLDYGSTDGLADWVRTALIAACRDGRLRYHRCEMLRWHVSHAKNVAHRLASRPVVCNVDADNFAPSGFGEWLRTACLSGPLIAHAAPIDESWGGGFGRLALFKEDFLRMGGYDERCVGWSYDDWDLLRRTIATRIPAVTIPEQFIRFLTHDDVLRRFAPGTTNRDEDLAFGRALSTGSIAAGRFQANLGRAWGRALVRSFDGQLITV